MKANGVFRISPAEPHLTDKLMHFTTNANEKKKSSLQPPDLESANLYEFSLDKLWVNFRGIIHFIAESFVELRHQTLQRS